MTRDLPAFTSAFIRNNGGGATGNLLPPGHENPRRPNSRQLQPWREKIDAHIEAEEIELNPLPHRDEQTGEAE